MRDRGKMDLRENDLAAIAASIAVTTGNKLGEKWSPNLLSDLSEFLSKIFSKIPKIYHILLHCKMTLQIKNDGDEGRQCDADNDCEYKENFNKTMNVLERITTSIYRSFSSDRILTMVEIRAPRPPQVRDGGRTDRQGSRR